MDEDEVGGGGFGVDPGQQFHSTEAISAVVDEGFIGEDDDDYEDLYNDVNVGENFLHSLRRNEENVGQREEEVKEKRGAANLAAPPPPPPPQQPLAQTGNAPFHDGASSRVPTGVEAYQSMGFINDSNAKDTGVGRGLGGPAVGGFRVDMGQSTAKSAEFEERRPIDIVQNSQQMVHQQERQGGNMGNFENFRNVGNVNGAGVNMYGGEGTGGMTGSRADGAVGGVGFGVGGGGGGGGGGGSTLLFVGDLHWWTTDAELESELCKYGPIKELKIYDERASGKSKGFCHVEFFDPAAATACKERMNGHMFNGRPCVVAYASHYTIKKMGDAQVNRNQHQMDPAALNQPRRGPGDFSGKPGNAGGNMAPGGSNQGSVDNNGRGFGRGNWGRGNAQGGMGNRGSMGPMRNRAGGMGGRGLAGNGNGFGQGMGAGPPMFHPQAMMGQGFDPAFGGPMGRMGGYGGFPGGPAAPFTGILSSYGPVGNIGLPGVAPHVNPAFFGRGIPLNGIGMMPNPGVEGHNMGMWPDPNMGGWAGEEHGGRAGESSYGEEAASEHQHGEASQDRGPWPNAVIEKDRGPERDWSGSSERKQRDERGAGYERDVNREKDVSYNRDWSERRKGDEKDVGRERARERERSLDHERGREREHERERERPRDDRDRHTDYHRHRNRDAEYGDDLDRGRSSRTHSKSRVSQEEEHRSRPRDADYGKRRRLTSD